MSTTTLALLTALIAVIGSAVTPINNALGPKDSEISGVLVGSTDHSITAFITNQGKTIGAIHHATLDIQGSDRKSKISVYFDLKAPTVIQANSTIAVEFDFTRFAIGPLKLSRPTTINDLTCDLNLSITTGLGTQQAFRRTQSECHWPAGNIIDRIEKEKEKDKK